MLFTAFAAEFGLSVAIWLSCAALAISISGAIALVKSEGATAPPFVGFALGAFLTYYVVAVRHGFGNPAVLRWAPIGPSLGFAIGLIALWPWPRVTGQAVAGCLLLLQGTSQRLAGLIVLVLIGSLFAGAVPAVSTLIIVGSLAVSYWGRAAPWAEAQDAARQEEQAATAFRDQQATQVQEMIEWADRLYADPNCVLGLAESQDLAVWSRVFSEIAATPLLRSWEERFLVALPRHVDDPVAVDRIGRAVRMIRAAIALQVQAMAERPRIQAPGIRSLP